MDSECPIPNVQPTLDDGATPSAEACDQTAATAPSRASESTEARDRKLARDRARRRERLASETAEEKERRLSQRRVRDRARRAASRPSAHSEKARDRARRRERLASETAEEKERRLSQRRVRDRARRAASRPSAHSEKRLEQMGSTERQRRAVQSLHTQLHAFTLGHNLSNLQAVWPGTFSSFLLMLIGENFVFPNVKLSPSKICGVCRCVYVLNTLSSVGSLPLAKNALHSPTSSIAKRR